MTREAPWFPAPRGGRLAAYRSMRAAVEQLLEGLELSAADLVTAELARGAADVVDAARARQDPRLWLSTASRLESLLAKLQRAAVPAASPSPAEGARAAGDDEPLKEVIVDDAARLAELVGRSAGVRDQA